MARFSPLTVARFVCDDEDPLQEPCFIGSDDDLDMLTDSDEDPG